ncbi:MAG: gamma-glutamyltransferase family protein [Albidovulum sp.]
MLETKRSYQGMVTAPHHLAAQAGRDVLRDGGNAIEAMIAAASTIAVVYPHMNGLGGDGFWLIGRPGGDVTAIQGCGRSAAMASRDWYLGQGHKAIPSRGPLSALTVPGTVDGWRLAHELSAKKHGGKMPLSRLLEDAIRHAKNGVAVTRTLNDCTRIKLAELVDVPGYADVYLKDGNPHPIGARLRQERVARTLEQLVAAGLDDFYRGDLARSIAKDAEAAGSPLRLTDLESHFAATVKPLSVDVAGHKVFNMPPPTQGLASLLLLATYARIKAEQSEGFDFVHRLVEATKAAFRVRDRYVTDPKYMERSAESFLDDDHIGELAASVSFDKAAPWPHPSKPGDTVWLAATDADGLSVSFIQSIYWEFGSGVILPETGITCQNRGTSFSLQERHPNRLDPGRLPFHTIQPAMAQLSDGRLMSYGTMGGEGQPQTQAMIFARHVLHGVPLQTSITAPRWLLGRTWGTAETNLKIENRLDASVIEGLRRAGHDIEMTGGFSDMMGHAGAIVRHPDGLLEGAGDPRSDGGAAAY